MSQVTKDNSNVGEIGQRLQDLPDNSFLNLPNDMSRCAQENLTDGETSQGLLDLPDNSFLNLPNDTSRCAQENLTDGETSQGLLDFPDYSFLRQKDLHALKVIPFSSVTLWRRVGCGRFPRPIKISPQITVWRVYEVKQWLGDPTGWQL